MRISDSTQGFSPSRHRCDDLGDATTATHPLLAQIEWLTSRQNPAETPSVLNHLVHVLGVRNPIYPTWLHPELNLARSILPALCEKKWIEKVGRYSSSIGSHKEHSQESKRWVDFSKSYLPLTTVCRYNFLTAKSKTKLDKTNIRLRQFHVKRMTTIFQFLPQ